MNDMNVGSVDVGSDDLLRTIALLCAIGGDDTDIRSLRMSGDPHSKGRPRFTRQGRSYKKPEDALAEAKTKALLRSAFAEPMTGNVAVAAVFYRPNRQRIDADNMLKHVLDSATGIVWIDDSQVTAVVSIVELDPAHPRTVIAFAPHNSTMTRGTDRMRDCARCGTPFVVTTEYSHRRYCSNACGGRVRGHLLSEPVPCEFCGQPFKRATSAQRLCSAECRVESLRNRRKAAAAERPMSRCTVCDKELAHRRGGTCRDCWRNRNKR